jgi:hypothetical protein
MNDIPFECNSALTSCISQRIFDLISSNRFSTEIRFNQNENLIFYFQTIFKLLQGSILKIEEQDFNSFIQVIDILDFDAARQILSVQIPSPKTFEDSLEFIQKENNEKFVHQFETAILIFFYPKI